MLAIPVYVFAVVSRHQKLWWLKRFLVFLSGFVFVVWVLHSSVALNHSGSEASGVAMRSLAQSVSAGLGVTQLNEDGLKGKVNRSHRESNWRNPSSAPRGRVWQGIEVCGRRGYCEQDTVGLRVNLKRPKGSTRKVVKFTYLCLSTIWSLAFLVESVFCMLVASRKEWGWARKIGWEGWGQKALGILDLSQGRRKSTFNFAEFLEIDVADTGDRGGHILSNVKTSKDIAF